MDAAALRRRWDAAADLADAELRKARVSPVLLEKPWLRKWFQSELGAVATVQAAVDGKRWRPGTRPSGLMREYPVSLDEPEFHDLREALLELERLYGNGLDAEWDWAAGFPRGWPTSLKDRLRAYIPWYDS